LLFENKQDENCNKIVVAGNLGGCADLFMERLDSYGELPAYFNNELEWQQTAKEKNPQNKNNANSNLAFENRSLESGAPSLDCRTVLGWTDSELPTGIIHVSFDKLVR
jgi:hypothetical protein